MSTWEVGSSVYTIVEEEYYNHFRTERIDHSIREYNMYLLLLLPF